MGETSQTYIELFGKRVEGAPATALLIAIWMAPFFAGVVVGLALRA